MKQIIFLPGEKKKINYYKKISCEQLEKHCNLCAFTSMSKIKANAEYKRAFENSLKTAKQKDNFKRNRE